MSTWTAQCRGPWAEGTRLINSIEMDSVWTAGRSPETVAKMLGQLASAKQTAKLLLRTVKGPRIDVEMRGHVAETEEDTESLNVKVRSVP